jgi:3-dehydroquinate synthetase
MRFAAWLSERVLGAEEEWTRRQEGLLDALGLETTGARCEPDRLASAMRSDKKVRSGRVRFILSRCPGEWAAEPVDDEVLLSALGAWCGSLGRGGVA